MVSMDTCVTNVQVGFWLGLAVGLAIAIPLWRLAGFFAELIVLLARAISYQRWRLRMTSTDRTVVGAWRQHVKRGQAIASVWLLVRLVVEALPDMCFDTEARGEGDAYWRGVGDWKL